MNQDQMGKLKKQITSEIKQLPFTLGKLAGGIMAVIGFPGIIIIHRKPGTSWQDALPFLLSGIAGICIFLLSSFFLKKQMDKDTHSALPPHEKKQISMLSWVLFFIFIAVVIAIIYAVTGSV